MKKNLLLILLLCFTSAYANAQVNKDTPNLSFDDGSLNNWKLYFGNYAYNAMSSTYDYTWTQKTPAQTGNRIKIIGGTSSSNDPVIACSAFSTNPTNRLVARLGEPLKVEGFMSKNAAAEKMEYSFKVTENTTLLSYKLAAVLKVPPGDNHLGEQRPTYEMSITVVDDSGVSYTLPCSSYSSKADNANSSLTPNGVPCLSSVSSNPGDYMYQKWLSGNIDLSSQIGKTVTISIINHDCLLTSNGNIIAGNHEAYGYFWAETKKIELTSFSCENSDATIIAPEGFSSYVWTRSDGMPMTVPNPLQPNVVVVDKSMNLNGVVYSCAMDDANSVCGALTVSTVITPVILFPDFTSVAIDAGKIQFTNTSTAQGDSITNYYWDFGDGIGYSNAKNPTYLYTEFKPFNVKLKVISSKGCEKSISYNVLPTKQLIAKIFPPTNLVYNGQTKEFTDWVNISGLQRNVDYYIRYTNLPGTPTYTSYTAPTTVGNYNATFELSYLSLLKYYMDSVPTQDFTITKAPLTVTVDNVTKTYGQNISLLREGFTQNKLMYSGDKIYELELKCNGLADTSSVGVYAIKADSAIGLGVKNYDIQFVDGTLTINPKTLNVLAIDNSKIYGEQINPKGNEFFVAPGNLVGTDSISTVSIQCNGFDKLAEIGTDTIKIINVTGNRLSNYSINLKPALLQIQKKRIKIAANELTKTYGTEYSFTGKEFTTDLTQLVGNDSISNVQFVSQAIAKKAIIGEYSLTIKDILGYRLNNYDISFVNNTFNVNPMPITIIALNNNKEYGDIFKFSGNEFVTDKSLITGDTVSFVLLKSSGSIETAPIGKYDILASLAYGAGTLNYDFTYVNGELNVVKKKLIATLNPPIYLGYNAKSKDFTATLNVSGLVQNADYFIRYTSKPGTPSYNSFNAPTEAGDYTAEFELSTSSLSKYELTTTPVEDFTITRAPLTITSDDLIKVYGDSINMNTLKYAFKTDVKPLYGNDRIDELDSIQVSGVCHADTVGSYQIIPLKAKGKGVENYEISFVSGNLTIKPKPITIRAVNIIKVYGDSITPVSKSFYVDSNDLVANDTVFTVVLASAGLQINATVGSYAIKAFGAIGRGLKNYVLSYADAILQITKKTISVSASPISKMYGTDYIFNGTEFTTDSTQFVGSDSIASLQLSSAGVNKVSNVGEYSIVINGVNGYRLENYTINRVNGTLTVLPMSVNIIVDSISKPYGELYTLTGKEFKTDVSLLNGDEISYLALKSNGASMSAPVGEYDINVMQAYGIGTGNYNFSYQTGKFFVTKKPLSAQLIAPANLVYNAQMKNFTATINISGLIQNVDYYIHYTNKPGTPEYNSTIPPSVAGDYVVTFELSNSSLSKYELTSIPQQNFTITKAPLTITLDDFVKIYGDSINLTLLKYGFKTDIKPLYGFDKIDELDSIQYYGICHADTVGIYQIIPLRAKGKGIENYAITFVPGKLTIKQKSITIRALNTIKVYGDSIHPFSKNFYINSNDLIGNDTVYAVNLTSTGLQINASVGNYVIIPSQAIGRGLQNYSITYSDAMLQIVKKNVTVTANALTKLYGDEYLFKGTEYTTDYSQFVGNDSITSVQFSSAGANKTSNVGEYSILITGVTGYRLENYTINQVNSTLKVTPVPVTIIADNITKQYGDVYTLAGSEFKADIALLNGDQISYLALKSNGTSAAAPVGEYDINILQAYGTGTTNYNFSYQSGKLSVVKKILSAQLISPENLVYNAQKKEFTAILNIVGLIQNVDYFIHYTNKAGTGDYDSYIAPKAVGDYTVTFELSSLSLQKYSMDETVSQDFTIQKASLIITANDASKTYGQQLSLRADAYQMSLKALFGSDAISEVILDCKGLSDTASVKYYPITPVKVNGTGIDNYDIHYVSGLLVVNPKKLVVKAADGSKIYGDIYFPNSQNIHVDANELIANDMVTSATLNSEGNISSATIGSYPITVSNAVGTRLNNYQIVYENGNLQVLPKKITVSPKPIYKEYGKEYVYKGDEFVTDKNQFVGSDKITGVILNSQGSLNTSSVGQYVLSITNVSGNGLDNYDISTQKSVLFVTPKPIVVIGNDMEKEFGDVLTFSGNEFTTDIPMLNNDTISFAFLQSSGATGSAPIGMYDIVPAQASGAGSLNYNISYRPGKLNVIQKQLIVQPQNCVKEYGDNDPEAIYSVKDKRGIEYQPTMFSGKISREPGENVGVYNMTKGTLTVSPSYNYTFNTGYLTIKKAMPTIYPAFTNNNGQFLLADVSGSKYGNVPTGSMNLKIKESGYDNTIAVTNGFSKCLVSNLPDHMVDVEFNYSGDNNYLPASKTIRIYAVVYHLNGGQIVAPITNFDGNESVKLETPTHSNNYIFEGWYENEDFSGEQVRRIPIGTYRDVHLYAKWLVSYDDLSIVVLFNQVLAVANPLNREFIYNSTFKWYKDNVQLESVKQYCGFENYVPTGNYKVEIYYLNNAPIVLELNHSATIKKAKVFPNPLLKNSQLTVSTNLAEKEDVSVEVYNLSGIRQTTISVEKDADKFSLDGFNESGAYILRLVQAGEIKETFKVIVKE